MNNPHIRTFSYAALFTLLAGVGLYIYFGNSVQVYSTEKPKEVHLIAKEQPLFEGDHVVVNLHAMTVSLRQGTETKAIMNIVSVGKPGSYYETIGGVHENDYTIKNHYSSIGHVYMPWSVHVFGNFFIHGIPYYKDGTKVSSEYSGGCIRLSDEDAERVYRFIQKGTPIVVTKGEDTDFIPTATSTEKITSMEMTRYMAATVSLEVLTQDDPVYNPYSSSYTTRRKLLPKLISEGDDSVIAIYASARGNETFLMYMNLKASSLGLTNTTFTSVDSPATTSEEDLARFKAYISTYKTYLLGLATSTQQASH